MRKEIEDFELKEVNGGRYYINVNTNKLTFSTINNVYNLKCDPYDAMRAMDNLSGSFNSAAEYDQACLNMLKSKGWV